MDIPPVDEAWKSFNEHYCYDSCDDMSLCEDSEESEFGSNVIPYPAVEHTRPKRRLRGVLRAFLIAAALFVILLVGSLTAYAMGYNVWDAMAQWTEDTFSFMAPQKDMTHSEEVDPGSFAGIRHHGKNSSQLAPDGYQYAGIEISDTPMRKAFYISYINDADKIRMTISLLSDLSMRTYENSEEDAVVYKTNGISHYITQNFDITNIMWTTGNSECSISGHFSVEEAQNIIDSIYGS